MPTNLEHRARDIDRGKNKVGGRPAKPNDKKGDRNLEQQIKKKKTKETFFYWKNNMKILLRR